MNRLTRWRLQELAGKMPTRVFEGLLEWELIPAPGPDGNWDPEIADRMRVVLKIGQTTKSLPRRALLLGWEGYSISLDTRRKALAWVLGPSLRPAATKMKQIREEMYLSAVPATQDGRKRRPRLPIFPLAPGRYPEVVQLASDAELQVAYQQAFYYADLLREVGRAYGFNPDAIPKDERLALVVVLLLLRYNDVRRQLRVPEIPGGWEGAAPLW